MAKKEKIEQEEEVTAQDPALLAKIAELEKENAELKAASKPVEKPAEKDAAKGITIQHVRPVRQWTVLKTKVLKVHRGTGTINNPKFARNIVLTPGCVVTVTPELAKQLIKSKDFQKYGVER